MRVDEQFNSINEKLQQLLKQLNRYKKENEQLKTELATEREEKIKKHTEVTELHQQIGILKLAASDMNDKDKKEFERKINQYIKELDKCIAFLGK